MMSSMSFSRITAQFKCLKMWNNRYRQRHTYLQSKIQVMSPQVFNQSVETAMWNPTTILSKRKVLNSQLPPLEPQNFAASPEPFKLPLAFGLGALPKVLREILSKDMGVQYKALNTLTNLLVNPLECNRAISGFDVVLKLEAILLSHLPESRESMPTIDKVLRNFEILASNFAGAWRMVGQCELMQALYHLIESSPCLKFEPASILGLMSSHPTVADVMLLHNHLKQVAQLIKRGDQVGPVFDHLSNLIRRAPARAMEEGFFDLLLPRITVQNCTLPAAVKCFALLLSTPEGHEKFDDLDGVKLLYEVLKIEGLPCETLEYVALALQNCTISKRALWRCREFYDLPLILIRGAHCRTSDNVQLHCIQALRQITTVPSVKDFVRKTCKKQVKAIECRREFVRGAKERLLQWLRKKNYVNVEHRPEIEEDQDDEAHSGASSSEPESESISAEADKLKPELVGEPKPIAYRLHYGKVCIKESDKSPRDPPNATALAVATSDFVASVVQQQFFHSLHGAETGPTYGNVYRGVDVATVAGSHRVYNVDADKPLLTSVSRPNYELPESLARPFPARVEASLAKDGLMDHRTAKHPQGVESFNPHLQRTAFVSSPPASRVYLGVSKSAASLKNRRAAVSVTRWQDSGGVLED